MFLKSAVLHFLTKHADRKGWEFYLGFLCCLYAVILAFPPFYNLQVNPLLEFQIQHPFSQIPKEFWYESHAQKHQFRIAVPLICHLLHLRGYWPLLVQYISAYLLFVYTYRLSARISGDKLIATFCTIIVANIFIGMFGTYDVFWRFDCFALLMLTLACYSRNVLLIGSFLLLAYFTDERAFIASSLVLLYHAIRDGRAATSVADYFVPSTFMIVTTWLIYGAIRYYLAYHEGFITGTMDIGPSILLSNYNTFPLSILFTFESAWYFILYAFYKARKDLLLVLPVFLCAAVMTIVALMVMDVSRSTTYLYPLFFIGLLKYCHVTAPTARQSVFFTLALLAILIPTQEFYNSNVYGMGPVFPKITKLF